MSKHVTAAVCEQLQTIIGVANGLPTKKRLGYCRQRKTARLPGIPEQAACKLTTQRSNGECGVCGKF
jgi:hypothetical protein